MMEIPEVIRPTQQGRREMVGSPRGLLCTLVGLLIGCGSTADDEMGNDGGAGGASGAAGATASIGDYDAFAAQARSAVCNRVFSCLNESEWAELRLLFEDLEECEAALSHRQLKSPRIQRLRDQLATGNLRYVEENARICLGSLESCHGTTSLEEGPCAEVVEGNAALGEPCYDSVDCASDAFCALSTTCPGTCQSRKGAQSSCLSVDECTFEGEVTHCAQSTCVRTELAAPADVEEMCTVAMSEGALFIPCGEGLVCIGRGDGTNSGTCRVPLAEGAACNPDDQACGSGLWCESSSLSCVRVTVRETNGSACDEAAWVLCDPFEGLQCVATTCRGGDGSEGAICYLGEYQRGCEVGLYCDVADEVTNQGLCVPLLDTGVECPFDGACRTGTCNGVCADTYCGYVGLAR